MSCVYEDIKQQHNDATTPTHSLRLEQSVAIWPKRHRKQEPRRLYCQADLLRTIQAAQIRWKWHDAEGRSWRVWRRVPCCLKRVTRESGNFVREKKPLDRTTLFWSCCVVFSWSFGGLRVLPFVRLCVVVFVVVFSIFFYVFVVVVIIVMVGSGILYSQSLFHDSSISLLLLFSLSMSFSFCRRELSSVWPHNSRSAPEPSHIIYCHRNPSNIFIINILIIIYSFHIPFPFAKGRTEQQQNQQKNQEMKTKGEDCRIHNVRHLRDHLYGRIIGFSCKVTQLQGHL